jgi:hypothetical protein
MHMNIKMNPLQSLVYVDNQRPPRGVESDTPHELRTCNLLVKTRIYCLIRPRGQFISHKVVWHDVYSHQISTLSEIGLNSGGRNSTRSWLGESVDFASLKKGEEGFLARRTPASLTTTNVNKLNRGDSIV